MTFVMPTTRENSLPSKPSSRLYSPYRLSLSPTTRLFRVLKGQEVEVYRMWWVPHPDQ